MTALPSPSRHWLIWDGGCGFCRRAAKWFRKVDRDQRFSIVPSQECPSPPMTPELARLAKKTMIVIAEDGRVITGGRSVLFALEEAGWHPGLMRFLGNPPFVWAIDLGYRIVAGNRQVFSKVMFRGK